MSPQQSSSKVALITIYEIGKILSSSLDINKTLRQVLNVIATHLNMQRGMVCTLQETESLSIIASIGFTQEETMRGRFAIGEGVTGRIYQTGFPAVIPNVAHEPLFLNRTGATRLIKDQAISFLGVPIKVGRETIGVLSFERNAADHCMVLRTIYSYCL